MFLLVNAVMTVFRGKFALSAFDFDMDKKSLLAKANRLPLTPGVYIMKDKDGNVIYVGKSRSLKNRVSQYFTNTYHGAKTERMISCVHDFDTILCDTETEALTLENSKIKQYKPKYNIKLKDDKTYPYVKLPKNERFPRITFSRQRTDDAEYFGPYTSSATARSIIRTVSAVFALPTCTKAYPKDPEGARPCLDYQIGRCCAPCCARITEEEYAERINGARAVLRGDIASTCTQIREKMKSSAERLEFEAAARYRDTLSALENLYKKQKVVSTQDDFRDVIGIYRDDAVCVISVFYIRGGMIFDTEDFTFTSGEMDEWEKISSFIVSLYEKRQAYPPNVLISEDMPQEDVNTIHEYLNTVSNRRVEVKQPQRGIKAKLCEMVESNARQRAILFKTEELKENELLVSLARTLQLEVIPDRIEAYDISNIGNEAITGAMIVTDGSKLDRKNYRLFNIRSTDGQDDYSSMSEMLSRRIENALQGEKSFLPLPDLILIDGGATHTMTVRAVLEGYGVDIPVFGMVKDEFHKTRALTDGESELSIAKLRDIYLFIYKLQEEVHRFAITNMKKRKTKTLTHSSLTKIKGVGDAKAKLLLARFGTVTAVSKAEKEELLTVSGITEPTADNIINYFKDKKI